MNLSSYLVHLFIFDVDHFKFFCICSSVASVLFFGQEACGISAPQPGIEPTPPALEGEVLTVGLSGKSLTYFNFTNYICNSN